MVQDTSIRTPKYRKQSNAHGDRAFVEMDGKRRYLGRHGSRESRAKYHRLIAESGANVTTAPTTDITVVELLAGFWKYAEAYYVGNSREVDQFRLAVRALKELYGDTKDVEFGPRALKAVRQTMIDGKASRNYANRNVGRIKRIFKWAVAEELIPAGVLHGLQAVTGLRRGRTEARETEPIRPVADATVDATLPHLTPTVRAMVELQRHTGMRPGEVCIVRTCDIDTSGKVWTFTPERHKTQYAGRQRTIYLGPKAQAVLKPLLRHDLQAYIFAPEQSEAERRDRQHAERVTPDGQGNGPGTNRVRRPKKTPGDRYATDTYNQALGYACDRAFPAPDGLDGKALRQWRRDHKWGANQLRHSFATHVRREHGLEAAQVLLGHAAADVTQVYAERDSAKAIGVALKIG